MIGLLRSGALFHYGVTQQLLDVVRLQDVQTPRIAVVQVEEVADRSFVGAARLALVLPIRQSST